jgi:signal transduction histidine kinase
VLLAVWAAAAATRHVLVRPWPSVAWTLLLVGGALSAGLNPSGPGASGPVFLTTAGLFLLVSTVETPTVWLAAAIAGGVATYAPVLVASGGDTGDAATLLISSVVGGAFGFLARLSGLDRRAERSATERRAEKAVLEERARIARDIHDVLAHSLGGLVIQLDALEAVSVARDADEDVLRRVRGAREMAADGLVEAKRAVDALRRLPAGLDAALGEIVAGARRLGTTVGVDMRGDPAAVPATVAEVVASVTVETLTNARKHAPGAPVDVAVSAGRAAVVLRVSNPMPADPPPLPAVPSGGHGVRGMRERAQIVGGTLDAQERDGVWTVECRVPYE